MKIEIVEGSTVPLAFQLETDNETTSLYGMTVELMLFKANGDQVDTASDITLDVPADIIYYNPDPTDLVAAASPLSSRFAVTDPLGRITYFPSGKTDLWVVRTVPG